MELTACFLLKLLILVDVNNECLLPTSGYNEEVQHVTKASWTQFCD